MAREVPIRPIVDAENPMWCPQGGGPENAFYSKPLVHGSLGRKLRKGLRDTTNVQASQKKPSRVIQSNTASALPQRRQQTGHGVIGNAPWRPTFPPNLPVKRKDNNDDSGYGDLLSSKKLRSNGSYDSSSFVLYDRDRAPAIAIPASTFDSSQATARDCASPSHFSEQPTRDEIGPDEGDSSATSHRTQAHYPNRGSCWSRDAPITDITSLTPI